MEQVRIIKWLRFILIAPFDLVSTCGSILNIVHLQSVRVRDPYPIQVILLQFPVCKPRQGVELRKLSIMLLKQM